MKHLFTFSSNSERLSRRDWIITGIIIVGVFCFIPILWQKIEKFNLTTDYRLPYNLSNDYWMFDQWCKRASLKYQVFIIGDSVIWGQYVKREGTLSHYLNKLTQDKSCDYQVAATFRLRKKEQKWLSLFRSPLRKY